jgi:AcrR family transcriptional regulator
MTTVEKLPARRPRNAEATRAAITQSATRLFARDGYEQVGVRDIAADAGVDPALVNRYFGSKEGLFVAVLESLVGPSGLYRLPSGEFGPAVARGLLYREGERSQNQLLALDICIRATASPTARSAALEDLERRFVAPMAERLGGGEDAEVRALVFNAMIFGAAILRELLGDRAAMRPRLEQLIAVLGPVLDRLAAPDQTP